MSKNLLKLLVGMVALTLSVCAGLFSISGLAKLFAGSAVAVIVMASTLEASKLVMASFLYSQWNSVNKLLKTYLLLAIFIIASITSIGIYGFLSGAYQSTKSNYELSLTSVDSLKSVKVYYDKNVETIEKSISNKTEQLNNLYKLKNTQENRLDNLVTNNRSTYNTDKSSRETSNQIKQVSYEIDSLNRSFVSFSDSSNKISVLITEKEINASKDSELGALSFISRLTGIDMDSVVNFLIILFMLVFDPLAITLVIAYNHLHHTTDTVVDVSEEVDNRGDLNFIDAIKTSNAPVEDIVPSIEVTDVKIEPVEERAVSREEDRRKNEKEIRLKNLYGDKVSF